MVTLRSRGRLVDENAAVNAGKPEAAGQAVQVQRNKRKYVL